MHPSCHCLEGSLAHRLSITPRCLTHSRESRVSPNDFFFSCCSAIPQCLYWDSATSMQEGILPACVVSSSLYHILGEQRTPLPVFSQHLTRGRYGCMWYVSFPIGNKFSVQSSVVGGSSCSPAKSKILFPSSARLLRQTLFTSCWPQSSFMCQVQSEHVRSSWFSTTGDSYWSCCKTALMKVRHASPVPTEQVTGLLL